MTQKKFPVNRVIPFQSLLNADCIDRNIFLVDGDYELLGANEVHGVAGTDGGAVTLDIRKCTGTQAPTAGVSMLASTFNLKAAALTPQFVGPTTTYANRRVAKGDRIALDFAGVTTTLADVVGGFTLKPL